MHMFSLMFVSLSIAFVSAITQNEATERSKTAMDSAFQLTEIMGKLGEKSGFFTTRMEIEPITPFLIERNWVKDVEIVESRRKRVASPSTPTVPPPPPQKAKPAGRPKLVLVTEAGSGIRTIQYVYVVFAMIVSLALLAASIFSMLNAGTVVVVRNVYDENIPARDFPASLTMFVTSKRQEKTAMETGPPEKPKSGLTREKT